MTNVLVCGLCPLPFENTRQSFGPGIRTWQFAYSLAEAGFNVRLLAMRIPGTYDTEQPEGDRHEVYDGVTIERLPDHEFFQVDKIRNRIHDFAPDVLIGATMYGSNMLAQTEPDIPFWADQFGSVMAEAQAKAHLDQSDHALSHFWSLLQPILRRADKISTVSGPQRYATIGELGIIGRLTHETCGYEFTEVIPCALIPKPVGDIEPQLRGSEIPEDAFVVLWSGGYNVWSDVETMFKGLEIAMEAHDGIYFVSTGGEIEGHDESTYARFQELIEASEHRDRFHLQGWVKAHKVPSYQAEADLGVLSEIPIYEGQLGSKNRIVQWMGSDLPALYNRVGELGDLLRDEELGLTFEVGDFEAMGQAIVWAAEHRDELEQIAQRARRYTDEHLTFKATTQGLVDWAAKARRAPDHSFRERVLSPADYFDNGHLIRKPAPPTDQVAIPEPIRPHDQELDPTESFLPDISENPVTPVVDIPRRQHAHSRPGILHRLRRRWVG